MDRVPVRSTLFNISFFVLTAIACILCLPMLVFTRRYFMGVVHFFVHKVYFLEKYILGLNYEVRGAEYLPSEGSFIIAAKHQSAYETLKLHMLFKDPAVILKKELLSIPLWGLYLKKSGPIAIDRTTPDSAIESIQDGAKHMKEQGRPIIIFPQGTRVRTDQTSKDKPFKIGIARIQEATELPIIPMALNAGLFWPRSGWLKSSGCVIFEFLEPIKPGLEKQNLMKKLEKEIEDASTSLMNEAKEQALDFKSASPRSAFIAALLVFVLVFGAYSLFWFEAAKQIRAEYVASIQNMTESERAPIEPNVSGYPGKFKLHVASESFRHADGSLKITDLRAEGWPIPSAPVKITTGPIEIKSFKWAEPLTLDSLYALINVQGNILTVRESTLRQADFEAVVKGTADLAQQPVPLFNLNIRLKNHASLLRSLSQDGIVDPRMAAFYGAGLSSLANEDGIIDLPLNQKDQTLFAGPIPVMQIR